MSTLANWVGNFKTRYGRLENPLPNINTFAEEMPFVRQDYRPGIGYEWPIVIGNEHGQTADVSNTAFPFNPPVDSQIIRANLDGATIAVIGDIPYDVDFRGMNGAGNGSQGGAFWAPYDAKHKLLLQSAGLYRELLLMYGCGGAAFTNPACNLGVISTTPAPAGTFATPNTSTITLASNAPGLWVQMIGAKVDVLTSAGVTRQLGVTVQGYDPDTGLLTLFASGSGITPVAGDKIVPFGWKQKSAIGLEAWLLNTGTLAGINAALVPFWKSVQLSAGGALSRTTIQALATRLVSRGYPVGKGGKLYVAGPGFNDLLAETYLLQRFDKNTDSVKQQGAEELEYKTAIGVIKVVVNANKKQGQAFFMCPGMSKRVGSTDVTTKASGSQEMFLQQLENNAGYRMRTMQNQAPGLKIPAYFGIITGIVNSATSGATGGVA